MSLSVDISFTFFVSRLGLRLKPGLSFSRTSSMSVSGAGSEGASQSRLLCFVVTAIAKLAAWHRELLPRARVSLAKVCILNVLCSMLVYKNIHFSDGYFVKSVHTWPYFQTLSYLDVRELCGAWRE